MEGEGLEGEGRGIEEGKDMTEGSGGFGEFGEAEMLEGRGKAEEVVAGPAEGVEDCEGRDARY